MSETLHYAAKKQAEKAYATGYEKGKSDAVKQLYVSMQKQRNQVGSVRLYPYQSPEQRIHGSRSNRQRKSSASRNSFSLSS